MIKKIFKYFKEKAKVTKIAVSAACMTMATGAIALASETPPAGKSMISAETKTMLQGFASSMVPTVVDMITLLVPTGLTLWGIGWGVKKGIAFLQRKANKTM